MALDEQNDWQPVGQRQEVDDWQPVGREPEPQQITDIHEPGGGDGIPEPWVDRVQQGEALKRFLTRAAKAAETGFGPEPLGLSDESIRHLQDVGIFRDPAAGRSGPIRMMNEQLIQPSVAALDGVFRSVRAGAFGAAGLFGQFVDEFTGQETRAEKEAMGFADWALIEAGFGRFSRTGSIVHDQAIGTLPRAADFKTGAEILAGQVSDMALAEKNLRDLWQERGIHPAEAVADAQGDAFLQHDIAPPAITAYHASPHVFDAFDINKIGTGQGAQSFGHGLYFSEGLGTHKTYLEEFGADVAARRKAQDFAGIHLSQVQKAIETVRNQEPSEAQAARLANLLRDEENLTAKVQEKIPEDAVSYQVRINANRDHLLDWDKPLSEQSEHVQAALKEVMGPKKWEEFKHASASTAVKQGFIAFSEEQVSAKLRDAGIPGIKYLDQGSRPAVPEGGGHVQFSNGKYHVFDQHGAVVDSFDTLAEAKEAIAPTKQTSNFVIFDDSLVEITHKNGVELKPTVVAPPLSSPVPQGVPRSELGKTGEPHIDAILDHPTTKRAIDNAVVDRTHTVPYTAGGSVPMQDPTFYIDRRFPESFTIDGVTFDPADPFAIHENVEQHVMEKLIAGGMKPGEAYRVAHFEYAEKAEGAWYEAHGIDQARAEEAYAPHMAQIQHEGAPNVPSNLYKRPYPHDQPSAAQHEAIAEPKPSAAEIARARQILEAGPERLAAAAVTLKDGQVFTAPTHGEAAYKASQQLGISMDDLLKRLESDSKWMTTEGRVIDKGEAARIASQNKQFKAVRTGGPIKAEDINMAEANPASLGAAATDLPPDVPLTQQPAQPPGRLAAAVHNAINTLFDIGRDIQMWAAPMARGTPPARAIAKDFANAMRRNRWDWSRIDSDIEKRFTPEQRERMWNAADEESVARQLGESLEHQGLVTLTPEELAAVNDLQARAQTAWLRAVDLGMVEGDGLPSYTPRMVVNAAGAVSGDGALPLNSIGQNLQTRTAQMMRRKHMTAEGTEAAAKAKLGEGAEIARDIRALPLATGQLEDAIAGRTLVNAIKDYGRRTGTETVTEGGSPAGSDKWFTIDHPALRTWKPDFDEAGVPRKDADGNMIFRQVPIYIHGDFEGPLRAVLSQRSGAFYGAMMSLKAKTMSLIMNSPMIHNAVEWGRAVPAMPGKVATFRIYFEGNAAKQGYEFRGVIPHVIDWATGNRVPVPNGSPTMIEAINAGLVPIGKRFFNQDISAIMEAPDLSPGRSWTAKVMGAFPYLDHPLPDWVPGKLTPEMQEAASTELRRGIDKLGDFWHNTLLWDRIADLQMGLYTNFRDNLIAKGVDRDTAARAAAHWANRYAGALPKEAMSDAATKIANFAMFSRTFTMGNIGAMKDIFTGLPKDVLAQIERDAGVVDPNAVGYAKAMARRKAAAVIGMDIALMYVGNSVIQSVINVMRGDNTLDKEMHGYAERLSEALQERRENPLKLLQPFDFLEHISSTYQNEPGKQDRIRWGYAKDGTAVYMRNPVGKIGEEFTGYLSGPLDMIRRKLGTIARPAWQTLANDKGFGRKVYDPNAETIPQYFQNMANIVGHFFASQAPTGQIGAGVDLVKGEGDPTVNKLQAFGPFAGLTFSRGAPGGPAIGEMYHAKAMHQYKVDAALPDIRRQIQRGDIAGAQERMRELGIPPGLQRFYNKTSLNPSTRLGGRTLRDFFLYATPEQHQRLENAR